MHCKIMRFGVFTFLTFSALADSNTIVSLPFEYTYLLPTFTGDLNQTFINSTKTSDASVNVLLASAAKAPFISYDDEFLSILGRDPTIELIAERDLDFAFEAGVWVPERNEVFFTSSIIDEVKVGGTHFEVLNLRTKQISNLTTSEPVRNPNGGDYHNGLVYLTTTRSIGATVDYNGGIVSIDPATGKVEHILNSYFGLQFTDIDDVAWATDPKNGKSYLYFTQFPFIHAIFPAAAPMALANAVWRWDPQEKILLPIISRTDISLPDGIRVSPDQESLYVTDFAGPRWTSILGVPAEIGSPAIYKYDLDTEMRPVNRRLFGYPRMGGADGIHIDDKGRVWTAEGDGIVVRRLDGKILGVFNSLYFGASRPSLIPIANFALAGDILVVLGVDRIFTVKLAEVIVRANKGKKTKKWSFASMVSMVRNKWTVSIECFLTRTASRRDHRS